MPRFSQKSKDRLSTCHPDIIKVLEKAIRYVDFTVIYGHRTVEEQQALYDQGRTMPGNIVTNCDGVNNKSNHNYSPSRAVDIAPYPIDWKDTAAFGYVSGCIMQIANEMYESGEISHRLRWGGDWNGNNRTRDERFLDLPHLEIVG